MSVVTPGQLHVNAVSKTVISTDELAQVKSETEGSVSKAVTNINLTSDQKVSVLLIDLCARYRPLFDLSMSEPRRCTNSEATFLLTPNIRPIDRHLYSANP